MVRETFEQQRLGATLRACRALRHEFATPLSAAALHLEVARRAAARSEVAIPEKLRAGLETGKEQLDEASRLLEGLTALGSAHEGDPGLLDFAALVARAARARVPDLEQRGLTLKSRGPSEGALVDGFADELESATGEALLTASRWAAPGEARLETRLAGRNGRRSRFASRSRAPRPATCCSRRAAARTRGSAPFSRAGLSRRTGAGSRAKRTERT